MGAGDGAAEPEPELTLTTSLQARHSFVNHAELPIIATAASSKTGRLLVCDGRLLHLYDGTRRVQHVALPTTVRARARYLHSALAFAARVAASPSLPTMLPCFLAPWRAAATLPDARLSRLVRRS